jgi:hypothetical protein
MTTPRSIKLIVPAERGSVRLARILAAGVAADAGLSIDDAAVDDLALEILRVVVDDHSFDADESGRRFRLVKRTRIPS